MACISLHCIVVSSEYYGHPEEMYFAFSAVSGDEFCEVKLKYEKLPVGYCKRNENFKQHSFL